MRLLPPEPKIEKYDGFKPEHDIFGHKDFGNSLLNIFSNVEDPLVLLIDAPWGAGKTTFAKMWAGHMRNKGFPVIQFDAFANDYILDAFDAISGEIFALANELDLDDKHETVVKSAAVNTIKMTKILLPKVAKIVAKGLAKKAIGGDAIEDLVGLTKEDSKEMAGDAHNLTGEVSEDTLSAFFKEKSETKVLFKEFKDSLESLAKVLLQKETSELNPEIGQHRQVIFIIDELDRCRPSFALEVLETIKHFFSIEGISFVLVTNLDQMKRTVTHAYGTDAENSLKYLEKFYNIHTRLPGKNKSDNCNTDCYLQHLSKFLPDDVSEKEYSSTLIEVMKRINIHQGLGLRSIGRVWSYFNVVLVASKSRKYRPPYLLAALCVMKVDSPYLYEKAKEGTLSFAAAVEYFKLETISDEPYEFSDNGLSFFKAWLRFGLEKKPAVENMGHFGDFSRGLSNYSFDRLELMSFMANNYIDNFNLIDN